MPNHQTTTLILAGGKGSRINDADKGLLELLEQPLVSYSASLAAKNSLILILANRNLSQYSALGYDCITDNETDFAGPMVAIWQAANTLKTPYVLVLPCDMPLLPKDIASQLLAPVLSGEFSASYARHEQHSHYCCMAAKLSAFKKITTRPHSMRHLLAQLNAIAIDFNTQKQSFLNVNTEQDLFLTQRAIKKRL